MSVQIQPASLDDLPIVRNMVAYYIYDMSEFLGWPCKRDGTFGGCDDLEAYWHDTRKHPFVLKDGDEVAGFALVSGAHDTDIDFSIGEFFVLRKFRGEGIGQAVAVELFDTFRGRWIVEQLKKNTPAVAFWNKVIHRYTDGHFKTETRNSPWGEMTRLSFAN